MAFGVQAIAGSTTISLTDGAPFKLRRARGMAGPPIRRVTARGPAQHGDTDLGYRLQPREIELELLFHADSDALLDGYRDDLMAVFKPLTSTPVNLRVTRDDDEVRQIDVFTVGAIKIDLVPEERAAHLHRATIRLRAPDPTWYDPVPGTASVQGTPTVSEDWYYAGGAIGTARVLMSGTAPAQREAWSYSGTIPDSYTLAMRTGPAAGAGYYYIANTFSTATIFLISDGAGTYEQHIGFEGQFDLTSLLVAGTSNYYLRAGSAGIYDGSGNGESYQFRRGTAAHTNMDVAYKSQLVGGSWRGANPSIGDTPLDEAIQRYALFSPGLTYDELVLVDAYMAGTIGGTISSSAAVQLDGDMPDYPTISITGPITDPYIYNVYTAQTLGLNGTVGAGTTWVIDLRHGYKTILEGTVNRRDKLETGSDLAEWHLSPDFSEGSNAIIMGGVNFGTATTMQIVYHHRYSSY